MAGVTATATAFQAERTPAYSWFVLAVLAFLYTLNFLDRQLVGTLGVQIQDALQINGKQLGLVTGTNFAIFYCLISIPVGLLADRTHRVRIVALGGVLFSAFTAACGLSQNFSHLVIARMGVGLGEAGGAPPSYSLVSDYFPPHRRGMALALFSLGVPFGAALGVYAGATIAKAWDWRMPFYVVGGVGVVAAILVLILVREPKRGATDVPLTRHETEELVDIPAVAAQPKAELWATVKMYFSSPVLVMVGIAAGTASLTTLAQNLGIPQILQREKGMSLDEYAVWYALVLGISQGAGGFLSGWLVDKLGKKNKSAYAYVPTIALALAIPFYLAFVWTPGWRLSLVFLSGAIFLSIFYLAPAIAVVVNSVSAAQRTLSSALLLLLLNGLGFGLGPLIAGALSDYFKPTHPGHFWQVSMYWLTPFYLVSIVCHLFLARQLRLRQERAG
jgi:MFS family permease